jgi:type II secretory ATPase GspE/PulE/Tfp pilus assembly ATPase PilB-like protein
VMAQRLIRRLDDNTKIAYQPDEMTMNVIRRVVDSLPPTAARPNLENIQLYKQGSTPENPFGFKGQIAIREQFLMTPKILDLLQTSKVSSTQEIEDAAVSSGILKIIAGSTTIDEVFRVVG